MGRTPHSGVQPGGSRDRLTTGQMTRNPLALLQEIFARSGAEVAVFDPDVPIPQRPERLKRYLPNP